MKSDQADLMLRKLARSVKDARVSNELGGATLAAKIREMESLLAAVKTAAAGGTAEPPKLTVEQLERKLLDEAAKVPGGYCYDGICSVQYCFPLKAGGELRVMVCEADNEDADQYISIDHYDGSLPPGITGPVSRTGEAA